MFPFSLLTLLLFVPLPLEPYRGPTRRTFAELLLGLGVSGLAVPSLAFVWGVGGRGVGLGVFLGAHSWRNLASLSLSLTLFSLYSLSLSPLPFDLCPYSTVRACLQNCADRAQIEYVLRHGTLVASHFLM